MEVEEMSPPRSSSLKSGRDEEEEEDLKYTKNEKTDGQCRAKKSLVAARTRSAPASSAINDQEAALHKTNSLSSSPSGAPSSHSPSNPTLGKEEKNENVCHQRGKSLRY